MENPTEFVCSKILPSTRIASAFRRRAVSSMPADETCTRLPILEVRTIMCTVLRGELKPSALERRDRPSYPRTARNDPLP